MKLSERCASLVGASWYFNGLPVPWQCQKVWTGSAQTCVLRCRPAVGVLLRSAGLQAQDANVTLSLMRGVVTRRDVYQYAACEPVRFKCLRHACGKTWMSRSMYPCAFRLLCLDRRRMVFPFTRL